MTTKRKSSVDKRGRGNPLERRKARKKQPNGVTPHSVVYEHPTLRS